MFFQLNRALIASVAKPGNFAAGDGRTGSAVCPGGETKMADIFGCGVFGGRRMGRLLCRAAVFAALACLATACAGTDKSSLAMTGSEAAAAAPIPPGKARLVFKRVSAVLYVGAPASVKVNGNSVASVSSGGTETVDIAPGPSAVSVEAWSYPGTWTVNLNAAAGHTYTLEISPRGDSFGPSLLGPLGGVIDSGVNKNAGAFEMKMVGS